MYTTQFTVFQRLLKHSRIDPLTNCWIWIGSKNNKGYGRLGIGANKTFLAHRLCYEALMRPIPEDLELDHLCRTPACINPLHLEPVTHLENMLRGDSGKYQSRRTHCLNGHEVNAENSRVYIHRNGKSERICRLCRDAADKRWKAKREMAQI